MILNIESDLNRFRNIVRGKVRRDLKKYMASTEMVGKQGDKFVRIPLPQINIPRLRYGKNEVGGVGQGEGTEGEKVPGSGQEAGDQTGEHELDAELTIDELAEILGEELALPRIEPKGAKHLSSVRDRYTGITRVGPRALRHMRRTWRETLRRQMSTGTYDAANPVLVPQKDDFRFRSWNSKTEPQSAAAIIYVMDVSGSMGKEQKEIVRLEAFWIDTWLRAQYKHLETRFVIHDAAAREVDRDTFFRTRESGGTLISTAYNTVEAIVSADYPVEEWNLYVFQFSDGDNWSASDTKLCMEILQGQLLPKLNLFCYGQVESEYGSGQFINDLREHVGSDERVVLSKIAERSDIMQSIKEFLGKGR